MKPIFFCGDPHGKFKQIIRAVKLHKPSAIVLLGDIFGEADSTKTLEEELAEIMDMTDIWAIHGNHETDHQSTTDLMLKLGDRNIHGRVVNVGGVRIAGLGGVFRSKIWNPNQGDPTYPDYKEFERIHNSKLPARLRDLDPSHKGERRKHLSSIFPDVYERLALLSADVLVTHEAPSCHKHGYQAVDELAQMLGVHTAFHGHHHERPDYSRHYERIGFKAIGVGLRGISDLDGNVILPGESD